MKAVFADSGYWIALLSPNDSLHQVARHFHRVIEASNTQIITSEMVLTEFLNFFCKAPNFVVIPQTSELFDRALVLFTQRQDKQWSLTDCSSFLLMQELGITEALAHDKHFEQAGFRVLLADEI